MRYFDVLNLLFCVNIFIELIVIIIVIIKVHRIMVNWIYLYCDFINNYMA